VHLKINFPLYFIVDNHNELQSFTILNITLVYKFAQFFDNILTDITTCYVHSLLARTLLNNTYRCATVCDMIVMQ